MKKKLLLLLCLILACTLCSCGDEKDLLKKKSTDEFLLETSVSLAKRMDQLAESSSYIQLFTSSDEVTETVEAFGANTYEKPIHAFIIEISTDDFWESAGKDIDIDSLSDDVLIYVEKRISSALSNLINGQYGGASTLAASSILSITESYQAPENFTDNVSLLIDFGSSHIVMAGFMQSEEETVLVGATPIYLSDDTSEMLSSTESIEKIFSQVGMPGATVTEIPQETIDKVFSD